MEERPVIERSKIRGILEVTVNVAILLAAVTALSAFVLNYVVKPKGPSFSLGLARGTRFPSVPQVDFHNSPQTLLIAIDTKCSYCQDSVPFFQKLVKAQQESGKAIHIVALFPNPQAEVTRYIQQNQLSMETVAGVNFGSLRVDGTPMMILLNSDGEVDDFWIGKIEANVQEKIIKSLTS